MQEPLERAMSDLCFGPEIDGRDEAAVRGWLDRNQVAPADADAIVRAGVERLFFYRKLVRENLWSAMESSIPRTMARLGSVFDDYFARFLSEQGPKTRYLRDVTRELLDFCETAWRSDPRVPSYIIDLARHEAAQIELGAMDTAGVSTEPGPLDLERGVGFIEAARLARYDFAVHRLSDDPSDRSLPAEEPTRLFIYRSPEHEVRYLELTPLAAEILGRLIAGLPLGASVRDASAAMGTELSQSVLEGTARLLFDLAERGALTGARTSGAVHG